MNEAFESRGRNLRDHWTDIFRADFPIHFGLMGSIATACFQGWLKDRVGGPLPYALSDGCFLFAFVWWFGTRAFQRDAMLIMPKGAMLTTLLLVTLVPALYVAVPGTPLVVQLGGLRAWSLYPLGCIIALSIIRNAGQVRAYVGLILILCVMTAVYGILQYRAGPASALAGGVFAAERHGSTVFYAVQGQESQFRAFSTFTFPAPFAGMMVYGMVLAAGSVLNTYRTIPQRLFYALLLPLLFVAMTVSGTRAALVTLALGLGVVGVLRGFKLAQMLLAIPIMAAFHLGTLMTSGRATVRFGTIFSQESHLWLYVLQPIATAWRTLLEHPVGLGLGRTGVGVPFAITSRLPPHYFVFSDGDIGRAAVDMGVLGLIVLAFIVFGLIPLALKAARLLLGSDEEEIGLGIGALVISGGAIILIGSPLSSAPHGIIWWFFLGALVRLAMLRSQVDAEEVEAEPEEAVEVEAEPEPRWPRPAR